MNFDDDEGQSSTSADVLYNTKRPLHELSPPTNPYSPPMRTSPRLSAALQERGRSPEGDNVIDVRSDSSLRSDYDNDTTLRTEACKVPVKSLRLDDLLAAAAGMKEGAPPSRPTSAQRPGSTPLSSSRRLSTPLELSSGLESRGTKPPAAVADQERPVSVSDRLAAVVTASSAAKKRTKAVIPQYKKSPAARRSESPSARTAQPIAHPRHPSPPDMPQRAHTDLKLAQASPTLPVSPSVALMAVGTSQDQKVIALANANLRRELRFLREQTRQRAAKHQEIESSHHQDDSLDVLRKEAEELAHSLDHEGQRQQRLLADLAQLEMLSESLDKEVAAERMVRCSVLSVLKERRAAFDEWLAFTTHEKKRLEERRLHEILKKQLAAASAGDRMVRQPAIVRREAEELRFLVASLEQQVEAIDAELEELDSATVDARKRATELIAADDTLDDRMAVLTQYIESAQRVTSTSGSQRFL